MEGIEKLWFSNLDLANKTKLGLLEKYDTKEIWNLEWEELIENGISEEDCVKILKSKNLEQEKRIWEYMQQKKIQLISIKEENYPKKLHKIEDKPAFLYVRGNETILNDASIRCCRV